MKHVFKIHWIPNKIIAIWSYCQYITPSLNFFQNSRLYLIFSHILKLKFCQKPVIVVTTNFTTLLLTRLWPIIRLIDLNKKELYTYLIVFVLLRLYYLPINWFIPYKIIKCWLCSMILNYRNFTNIFSPWIDFNRVKYFTFDHSVKHLYKWTYLW